MPRPLVIEDLRQELAYVESELAKANLPFTLERMWRSKREEILSELKRAAAEPATLASVALVFHGDPVVADKAIELDFSSKALDRFQDLIENVYAEQIAEEVANSGPVKGKDRSRLFIEDVVHGSMGFLLRERPQDQVEAFDTNLSQAVEKALSLIDLASSSEPADFERLLEENSPRSILALRKLTDVFHHRSAQARIVSEKSERSLSESDVDRMFVRLHESVSESEPMFADGELKGIFPEEGQFEFVRAQDGQILHGKADKGLVERYLTDGDFRRLYVTTPITGQFKRTLVRQSGRQDKVSYYLEAVLPRRRDQLPEFKDES